ncbi:accessory gene regulator B family protein [Herbivorax sp. ANBcel31]|uniref:accessory gene regulator B family protein n=1 Tax=Herbivorax sp. ANBcel31 TaxID=3069754 RepID=UPI0027B46EC0|nr:accessory gene regulator B family protein [Herbivorax sp. ANBcel31]MDQ2087413.1 accessory gene regulator B family protein [Herbivorax sp. ANBcel31]
MINKLINQFIKIIKSNIYLDSKKEELVTYAMRIIIFELIIGTFCIAISLLLGVFKFLVVTTIGFGAMRVLAGGAHANSRLECFVFYNIIIWGVIYLSTMLTISTEVIVILMIINIFVLSLYAPGDTLKKPIIRKKKRKLLKIASIILTILLHVVALLIQSMESVISNILVLSSIVTVILLLPLGYKLCRCKSGYKNQGSDIIKC